MADHDEVRINAVGVTDIGRKRKANQDNYLIDTAVGLYVVADGMGGHDDGEYASRTSLDVLSKAISKNAALNRSKQFTSQNVSSFDAEKRSEELQLNLARHVTAGAVRTANNTVYKQNCRRGYPVGRGMGTTLAGMWFPAGSCYGVIFHVGDSRVYLYRNGDLKRLTRDHSLYQEWEDRGSHGVPPKRNVVLRAVGPWFNTEPDIQILKLQSGDTILVCSDGLTGMLSDEQIKTAFEETAFTDLQNACDKLIFLANEKGGDDNITAVIANVL